MFVGELIFAPKKDASRWYVTALYNRIDSDMKTANYQTISISPTYLLARNLRLMAELSHDTELKKNRVVVGVISAF